MRAGIAAGVVLLAVIAAGVWALVLKNSAPSSVVARCAQASCPTYHLVANSRTMADVMVLDGKVYLNPIAVPPNDPASNEYVLWRMDDAAHSVAIGRFDVRSGQSGVTEVGDLTVPLSDIDAFAVTKEPGRTLPDAPSSPPIARGTVG